MFNPFGHKCPRCGSRKINKVEESIFKKMRRFVLHVAFFITIFFVKGPKPLLVCTECGFSWEAR